MKYLMSQEEFEVLIGRAPAPEGVTLSSLTIVYFTATWCGACKKLDLPLLEQSFPKLTWLKCDVDQNTYTLGYCGMRSIPSFVLISNTKILGTLSSSNTEQVANWIRGLI
jgi:thioredoxin-like negative regulator of GroEL